MRSANNSLITTPADMSTSWESPAVWLGNTVNYSIQLVFTGVPVGNFKLQCSNDSYANDYIDAANVLNWTDVSGSQQPITAAGDHTWQVENAGYRWIRAVWLPTSGIGSIVSARFNTKGF